MGDKTQVATVALAAQFHAIVLVVLGTTARHDAGQCARGVRR